MFSKSTKIKTLMQANLVCVSEGDSLAQIAEIFRVRDFHHLPVVDNDGKIVGIISQDDLKYAMEQIAKNSSEKIYTQEILDHWNAKRFMTHNPTFLYVDDEVSKAAIYILQNKFHALPVLDKSNELVGIITSHDLLRHAYDA